MALTDKLTAIGAAIREKTGSTDLLRLDEMPGAIAAIETGGGGGNDELLAGYFNATITEFRVPNGVTNLMESAFASRNKLTKIDLNEVKTLGSSCFQSCSALVDIDTSKVETMNGYCFRYTPIKTLDLMSLKATTANMCYGMAELEEVKNLNVNRIYGSCFSGCSKLKTIDFSGVTYIHSSAFVNCTALDNIILPDIETIETTAFSGGGSGNITVTKIDIGANCKSIGANAFKFFPNVTAIIVRATTPPTMANVNAFNNIISNVSGDPGKYIYVPRDSLEAYWNATNWSAFVGSGNVYRAIEDYPEITGG